MDNIKLYAKMKKELEVSKYIQWWYMDGIWHRKMCHTNKENGKWWKK